MKVSKKTSFKNREEFIKSIRVKEDWSIKDSYLILIPMYASVQPLFNASLFRLINKLNELNIRFKVLYEVGTFVWKARDNLAKWAIKEEDYDRVIWLDSDVHFNDKMILHLMECSERDEYDMISPVIITRMAPHKPMVYIDDEVVELNMDNEWIHAESVGFGCVLMKRDILCKHNNFKVDTTGSGIVLGEDILYFREAMDKDLTLGVNLWVKIGHIGSTVWH